MKWTLLFLSSSLPQEAIVFYCPFLILFLDFGIITCILHPPCSTWSGRDLRRTPVCWVIFISGRPFFSHQKVGICASLIFWIDDFTMSGWFFCFLFKSCFHFLISLRTWALKTIKVQMLTFSSSWVPRWVTQPLRGSCYVKWGHQDSSDSAVVLIELIHVKYLEQHLTQNFHLINVIVILITVPFPFHYLDAFKSSIESFNEYLMCVPTAQ